MSETHTPPTTTTIPVSKVWGGEGVCISRSMEHGTAVWNQQKEEEVEVVVFPWDLKVNEKSPLLVQRLAYFASGGGGAAVSRDRMSMPTF